MKKSNESGKILPKLVVLITTLFQSVYCCQNYLSDDCVTTNYQLKIFERHFAKCWFKNVLSCHEGFKFDISKIFLFLEQIQIGEIGVDWNSFLDYLPESVLLNAWRWIDYGWKTTQAFVRLNFLTYYRHFLQVWDFARFVPTLPIRH